MDNRWDRKQQHLDKVMELARDRLKADEAGPFLDFAERFYARVPPEDVVGRRPDSLFAVALSLWRFAAVRTPGVCKVRVFNPTLAEAGWQDRRTSIEIVNDDMPFLVDSVSAELNRQGREIHLLVHPVMSVERDVEGRRATQGLAYAESYMYIEVDQQTDPAALSELERGVKAVLDDARVTFQDWQPMVARLREAREWLAAHPGPASAADLAESLAFVDWLIDDNFTFLGFRDYAFETRDGVVSAVADPGRSLGLLRDPSFLIFGGRIDTRDLSRDIQEFLHGPAPLIVMQSDQRSRVHRPVPLDYVGVKRYDDEGRLAGEWQFVGLFTAMAYSMDPKAIPLLRRKVELVIRRAGYNRYSHDGKILNNVLQTYPREELFQIDPDELYEIAIGIVRLMERPRAKAFVRVGPFGLFVSALVYIPRESFTTDRLARIEAILIEAYGGGIAAQHTQIGDGPLARLHLVLSRPPGSVPDVDPDEIDQEIAEAVRTWSDHLRDRLHERYGEEAGNRHWTRWAGGFSASYRGAYEPDLAAFDIDKLDPLDGPEAMAFNVYRRTEDPPGAARIKIYHASRLVPLSECLPKLENLGLKVIEEQAHSARPRGEERDAWVHDFYALDAAGGDLDLRAVKAPLEETLAELWAGHAEDDGLNALVLGAGLSWREVSILRAYLKYMRQAGTSFSQSYLRRSLTGHPAIARNLTRLFAARFDPDAADPDAADRLVAEINAQLEAVVSLDEDRIIRTFVAMICASLRTNYFQTGDDGAPKRHLSIKLASGQIDILPKPRPMVEIFVYAPWMEGIHLRGGKVARGGIRWSDRPEDFRTEILGLMKAQMVKNAVIVPVGAKGGFVPKRLPEGGGREEMQAEAIRCYRTLICGLLDITDNIVAGAVTPPPRVVRHDDDDPYLVVAADKGTASFSDIANEISADYGFWLGDAFASGGSNGYDHKAMGITARGAWIGVQRHFRELGVDVQTQPIRVIGIGDMSGDVFGNGMLRSSAIKLVAAFDHRHVFFDPEPDPAASFAERRRLFKLPRSSWADYDPALISPGGGVFPRSAKSVTLTPQIRVLLGVEDEQTTPAELIRALLRADADLLFVGGIGTYVKASGESHLEVGDKANDALRVDGRELRVKVVGEGGNLGFTQRGRIEYARQGGRLNTDAVDNSGGVDCSDHEVNIKILLNALIAEGDLTMKQRNALLEQMTEDVAALVLDTNYRQTEMLSTTEARAPDLLEAQARFLRRLEQEETLDRAIEFLPDDEEIARRHAAGQGLTRPELAVLMAYAKIALHRRLMRSTLPDEPRMLDDLRCYFPEAMRQRFADDIPRHQLRRDIVSTVLSNEIINRAGITFVTRVAEETGAAVDQIAAGYVLAREVMGLRRLWDEIDALDTLAPAEVQTELRLEAKEVLHRMAIWFLTHLRQPLDVGATVERFGPGVRALAESPTLMDMETRRDIAEQARALAERGAPADLANRVASLSALASGGDVVLLGERTGRPLADIARAYFAVGELVGLDWLREAGESAPASDHWERLAAGSIVEDLYDQQRELTGMALAEGGVSAWEQAHATALGRVRELIAEMRGAAVTVPRLGYVARQIRGLFASI
jgi:glutamate dehydrogenase